MPREIKFRIWDNGEMMQPAIEFNGNTFEFRMRGYGEVSPDRTLMQYTELKDKNGKEIYEGDLLREIMLEDERGKIFEVYYDTENAQYELRNGNHFVPLVGLGTGRVEQELVGNIFENGELLK